MLELYEDKSISAEDKEYFYTNIKELSISCKETLDKLLFWGKANMKKMIVNPQTIASKAHITNCLKLVKSAATQKNITINDLTTHDLRIYADPEHFEFVTRNLVANAIKFTFKNGNVDINSDIQRVPGFTVFSIKDTGRGIEPDKIPGIFDGVQKGSFGTANEAGTNIGLMLCKEFVTENGGKIWVKSELGKGSTFFFSVKSA